MGPRFQNRHVERSIPHSLPPCCVAAPRINGDPGVIPLTSSLFRSRRTARIPCRTRTADRTEDAHRHPPVPSLLRGLLEESAEPLLVQIEVRPCSVGLHIGQPLEAGATRRPAPSALMNSGIPSRHTLGPSNCVYLDRRAPVLESVDMDSSGTRLPPKGWRSRRTGVSRCAGTSAHLARVGDGSRTQWRGHPPSVAGQRPLRRRRLADHRERRFWPLRLVTCPRGCDGDCRDEEGDERAHKRCEQETTARLAATGRVNPIVLPSAPLPGT